MATACTPGTPERCDDMNACTTDACVESGAAMCARAPVAGCRNITPMSGSYALTPAPSYSCQDEVFKEPVVELRAASLRIMASASGVTVTGTPVTLSGGPVAGGAFMATGTIPNDCGTVITLSGTFSDERHFSGTLELAFAGIGCALTGCESQRYAVAGAFTM